MKLYFSPGACSQADHIALHEAGLEFEQIKVDLKSKRTASGEDFAAINPKGYVPTLVFDSGEVLTENVAILDWIAQQKPAVGVDGAMGRTRLLETLTYISTELHRGFKPFFRGAAEDEKKSAGALLTKRMTLLADTMKGDFLFGDRVTVADCYLFVMLQWAAKFGVDVPGRLTEFAARMKARPAVKATLEHEGLA